MGAALYVPDAQRVVRVVLRPCGDDSDAKACVLTAPLSSTVAEVYTLATTYPATNGEVHFFLSDEDAPFPAAGRPTHVPEWTALPPNTLLETLSAPSDSSPATIAIFYRHARHASRFGRDCCIRSCVFLFGLLVCNRDLIQETLHPEDYDTTYKKGTSGGDRQDPGTGSRQGGGGEGVGRGRPRRTLSGRIRAAPVPPREEQMLPGLPIHYEPPPPTTNGLPSQDGSDGNVGAGGYTHYRYEHVRHSPTTQHLDGSGDEAAQRTHSENHPVLAPNDTAAAAAGEEGTISADNSNNNGLSQPGGRYADSRGDPFTPHSRDPVDAGEMGAALYVPDAQRVVRVVLRPCGDDSDAKACVLTAPLSSTVAEVRSRLAAQLGGGGDNDAESASAASSPSWWSWATGRRGAEQTRQKIEENMHIFVDGSCFREAVQGGDESDSAASDEASTGEPSQYVAVPLDTTLEALVLALSGLSGAATIPASREDVYSGDAVAIAEERVRCVLDEDLTLYYGADRSMGNEGALIAMLIVAICACCTAIVCAASAAAAEKKAQKAQQQAAQQQQQQQQQQYQQQQQQHQSHEPAYYPPNYAGNNGNYAANGYGVPPPAQPAHQTYGQQPIYGQPVYGQPVCDPPGAQPQPQYQYTVNPQNQQVASTTTAHPVQPL